MFHPVKPPLILLIAVLLLGITGSNVNAQNQQLLNQNQDTIRKYIVIDSLIFKSKLQTHEVIHDLFSGTKGNTNIIRYSRMEDGLDKLVTDIILKVTFLKNDSLTYSLPLDTKSSIVNISFKKYDGDTIKIRSWKIYENCICDTVDGTTTYYRYQNGEMLLRNGTSIITEKQFHYLTKSDCPKTAFVATFAIGTFVILLKNGTVRLERGFTSITYTSSFEITY